MKGKIQYTGHEILILDPSGSESLAKYSKQAKGNEFI